MESEHQVPIWFFIGALLFVYGLIILSAGIYSWIVPPAEPVKLFQYHADVWWGILLTALGAFYSLRFRPGR